ncbi:MAG: DUF4185 domain-containing protein [Caldilineaceae bacterium]
MKWTRFSNGAIFLLFLIALTQFYPVRMAALDLFQHSVGLGQPPYPPSTYIVDLRWAAPDTVQRAARDSDSWTFTWADDDALYGAYGDGRGFEPFVDQKLSLGFVKVEGDAATFVGANIRSDGEQVGDGWKGLKPAGMLMVDGALYLWARNAGDNGRECQLARSDDHAQTWIWSDWRFAEFGYCTFINFGQNYAGARDDYVYMVSHDSPHAYSSTDGFILARVPKTQITDRSAYEFFQALAENGGPQWTTDVAGRGHVFENPGRAWRSSVVYNSAIGRYLWWQGHQPPSPTEDEPGFGIYEAPEPWGPWSTVYYTEQWDMASGDIGLFPSKWISPDGRTMHLITSAEDLFAVRRATLVLAGDETPIPTPTTAPTSTSTVTVTVIATSTPVSDTATPSPATATPSSTLQATATMANTSAPPTNTPGLTATVTPEPTQASSRTPLPTGQPPLGQQERLLYLPIAQR